MLAQILIALTLSGSVSTTPEADYVSDVKETLGCTYINYAQYLSTCRSDMRDRAWKRMVREDWLFFDKDRMHRFEEISKQYGFLSEGRQRGR